MVILILLIMKRRFFAKVLLLVPGMYEMKELEDSPDNQTFASISQ